MKFEIFKFQLKFKGFRTTLPALKDLLSFNETFILVFL